MLRKEERRIIIAVGVRVIEVGWSDVMQGRGWVRTCYSYSIMWFPVNLQEKEWKEVWTELITRMLESQEVT